MKRLYTGFIAGLLVLLMAAAADAAPPRTAGPVRAWVVIGPFPNPLPPGGRSATARGGFDTDYLTSLGGEAKAILKPGTAVVVSGGETVTARAVEASDGRLDFAPLFPDSAYKLAFAYAEIRSSASEEVTFFLGSDDGAKVWLNGKPVLDVYPPSGRAYTARQDTFRARLRRGVNTLLVKVENVTGGWELGVEVVDAATARALQKAQERVQRVRDLLSQEIGPLQSYPGYVFDVGAFPRIGWRDPETVRRLAGSIPLTVRWFDAAQNEVTRAEKPGRYTAWVEGRMPDGTPMRRCLSFYSKAPDELQLWQQDWGAEIPYLGRSFDAQAWKERATVSSSFGGRMLRNALFTSEDGAIFLAAMAEAKPSGHPARFVDSPEVLYSDSQLALKRKVMGLESRTRTLAPPRSRADHPAMVLREGAPEDAGVAPDARERIDAACRRWAEDSGEPLSVLVARHGVIVTHAAFGSLGENRPCTTAFRNEVASITKALSGMLFSQFVDQGLAAIDDPIGNYLPGFPTSGPKTLTFRHCFTHTSGLEGHGEWGGIWNPHLDNVILNQLPVLRPGERHVYNGMGYDLAGKAMELITGKSIVRLFTDHLFTPLGFEDVPIVDMAFGARLTAYELGVLGQWLANRGSYGDKQFISPATFAQILPRPLKEYWPAIGVEWGIGLTFMPERRPGAPPGSSDPKDFSLGPKTIGHGSATSCILRVDPDADLVIAMIRRTAGPRYDENMRAFFAAVADTLKR